METRTELLTKSYPKEDLQPEIEFAFATDPALVRRLADHLRQHRFPGEQVYTNGQLEHLFRQNLVEYLATAVPIIALRAKLPDLTILQQIQIAQNFARRALGAHNLPYKIAIRRYKKREITNCFLYLYVATSQDPRGPYATLEEAKLLTHNWPQLWHECLKETIAKPNPPWRQR